MDTDDAIRLRRVVSRLARQLNTSATSEGLTPTQASVLGLVCGRGPLGLAELAEIEGLNPTMLSRVVGKLGKADLIRRAPNPDDLRTAWVEATAKGSELHARIKARRTAIIAECTARLPRRQAAILTRALPALEALDRELQGREATPRLTGEGTDARGG